MGNSSVWVSYFKNLGSVKLTIKTNQTEGNEKKGMNSLWLKKPSTYKIKGKKDKVKKLR